ncbi:MAG: glycosyl hydrolase, partial [Bacteroidia bacterium]|nr:glycosyl hydrolase [Bacteroidia bacterium]
MKPMKNLLLTGIVLVFFSCNPKEPAIETGGPEVGTFKVLPFELTEVKLLDGYFKHATELNIQSLLNYQPDRLLSKFRSEAGLEPKAEAYGGWEAMTIAGHSLGHYLSACALMYQTSGDQRFLDRVNYIVDELYDCQQADGDGYIGAFPDGKRILEEEVAKGNIHAQGFDLNGIWVPFYTQHKVMAGLFEAYDLCGNQKALEINKRFADWLYTVVSGLNEEQIQKMLHCEHGGINESLAELYAKTGDEKYLGMSRIFHHKAILDPLAEGVDILPGKHGNTQIPKLVGLARRYELTGDTTDRKTAEFFWETVVNHHSYVTGGHGNHEYFGPADTLRNRLSNETTETCNVYNMLKLSQHLFQWEAAAEVADFYERALFNQILSSQHPETGHVIYNLSLEMGGHKEYQDPEGFTCCVGTGMENHSKYGRNIFFHNDDELYVTQFIAAELNWEEKELKIRQETAFPDEQGTKLTFSCETPVPLALKIRYPRWAENGMEMKVNGRPFRVKEKPGSFVTIDRKWKNGDVVEVSFPFSLRLETMPDDSNRVAVFYGPVVLAGDLGAENDSNRYDPLFVPVIMTENRDPNQWLKPVPGKTNTFITQNTGRPRDVEFKPFFATHNRSYSVYFDRFTEQGWEEHQKEYLRKLEAKKQLEAATIDFFQPGEMQPERDHYFRDFKTWVGENKNRKFREVDRGGWFSCDMKVDPASPGDLVVEYWGG